MRSAQVASKDAPSTGSVDTSRGNRVVCMCVVELRFSVLQRGQYGEVSMFARTLCKYDLRKGHVFVLGWARVFRVCIVRVYSAVFLLRCL